GGGVGAVGGGVEPVGALIHTMACTSAPTAAAPHGSAWALARNQHGVVTRNECTRMALSRSGIQHRIARGRLLPVGRGTYAVGRSELTQKGRWMAAFLG